MADNKKETPAEKARRLLLKFGFTEPFPYAAQAEQSRAAEKLPDQQGVKPKLVEKKSFTVPEEAGIIDFHRSPEAVAPQAPQVPLLERQPTLCHELDESLHCKGCSVPDAAIRPFSCVAQLGRDAIDPKFWNSGIKSPFL